MWSQLVKEKKEMGDVIRTRAMGVTTREICIHAVKKLVKRSMGGGKRPKKREQKAC